MTVLILTPHTNDEVLGMGGTITRYLRAGHRVVVAVLTLKHDPTKPLPPGAEDRPVRLECRAAAKVMGVSELVFRTLPAVMLDTTPASTTNAVIEELVATYQPDEVYLPFAYDLHKDHGAIAYAMSVAARPYLPKAACIRRLLAYETLTETHLAPPYLVPAFQPNVFINITDTLEVKLEAMRAYQTQIQPDHQPRSIAGLRALATLRGTHIGCPAAEAFVLLGEFTR